MKPFTNFESRMAPLAINNVDTDQIIPARFLKTTSKQGLENPGQMAVAVGLALRSFESL